MFFAFDVMGDVGFSKDFGNLASGREHPAIKGIHDHMSILGLLSLVPWFLYIVGCIPGAASGYTGFFSWCSNEIREKQKVPAAQGTYIIIFDQMLTTFSDVGPRSRTTRHRILLHEGFQ